MLISKGRGVLDELLLFDKLDFEDLTIPQLDALAIALGLDKVPKGDKDAKRAAIRPLFEKHAEEQAPKLLRISKPTQHMTGRIQDSGIDDSLGS